MKLYQIILSVFCLLVLINQIHAEENESNVVAKVMGNSITAQNINFSPNKPITCPEIRNCSANTSVQKLHQIVWQKIFKDFVKQNNLQATENEIQEFADYQKRFIEEDRKRRQKRLEDIKNQLKSNQIIQSQRSVLEREKATLDSLAENDRRMKAMNIRPSASLLKQIYVPWIENWKVNKAIFEKYGGVVATTKFGPDPVGARKMLIKEYAEKNKFLILNKELEKAYWKMLSDKPGYITAPDKVDFTPYWKRPLQPETKIQQRNSS